MKLSLNTIMQYRPCGQHSKGKTGISKLAKLLGKEDFFDKEEFDLMKVLESNGIENAIWCLRCFDYLDYCLFLADITESILYIYEEKEADKAPRDTIQGIRDYKAGVINKKELLRLSAASDAAAAAAYVAAAYASDAASDAAAAAAYAADAAYVAAAAYTAAAAAADSAKWKEIEVLFIKHFGEGL